MASKRYSRYSKIQERKNLRKTFFYIVISLGLVALLFFKGIPAIANFASFVRELNQSNTPVQKNDVIAPIVPTLEYIEEYTNNYDVEVKGSTEPGAIVIISINSKDEEVLANNDGEFTYKAKLQDGQNTIYAKAKDGAGNESEKSEFIHITYDNEVPNLEITKPSDGSEYYGSKQKQIVIEGSTEEKATVHINDRLVVVDSDGSFTFFTSLSEGDNEFKIVAQDRAGNETESSLKLRYTP